MTDDPRISKLLEEVLDSHRTPESVCAAHPELLAEVRERFEKCRMVNFEIEALFPPPGEFAFAGRPPHSGPADLPRVPGYEILGVLGHGGVGVVYRAKHHKLNRLVALKMLLSGPYASASELDRFTREAEAVASLQHAHVVQVHDVGDLDGRPYFTMELVEGGTLGQKLGGMPQPAPQAAALLATVAGAVDVAHRAGIVHRDLKPANVLLTPDGTPKITDFGLAGHIRPDDQGLTLDGARVGTPCYMAPEQASGRVRTVGPAADIYALGAILYEMLTGRPPFRAESASETQRQVISEEPVAPSRLNARVPRDLETVCLKCLRKEPERRYASAAALADDLGRFLAGRPIQARPPGWGGRLWRWGRREPAAAALAATALALAGLAVGGGFWVERQRAEVRATTARQEQAVEAALAHADDLQRLGHWPEARAALESAPRLLGVKAPSDLRERLGRAREDADMVVRLEGVRLRLSEGPEVLGRASPAADRLYADAFEKYGISLATPAARGAAAPAVRGSKIYGVLLVFLHDWLYWATDENRARLRDLVNAVDDDLWRRAFRDARARNDIGDLAQLASAPEAAGQPPALLSGLGGTLLADGRPAEAWELLRGAQRRHPGDFWINYLLGHYLERERPQEAVGYFRAAVAIRPTSNQAYALLGRALLRAGDSDGAIAALHESVSLNPSRRGIGELANALAPTGRLEEARVLWEKMLANDPPDHDRWYGYAQLCAFLGKDAEYRRAREAILRRFGASDDWIVAERTSLACLLLPDSADDLRAATALADRAVAGASKSPEPDNAYVQLVKGLAEYRLGRFAQAVPLLRASASKIPSRPGPRLALAMAQFRSGSPAEARRTLGAAVATYDWKTPPDEHPTVWTNHVLRREAEAVILPDLPAFLRGKHRPLDNDERLALLGICQSQGRYAAAAQLYADAFAADPDLGGRSTAGCAERAAMEKDAHDRAQVLKAEMRFLAARCAASAGCGTGIDGPGLSETERQRWRMQAREWLRADLAAWTGMADHGAGATPDLAGEMLKLWQGDPDLGGLRESDALDRLPEEERPNWSALWQQIGGALAQLRSTND